MHSSAFIIYTTEEMFLYPRQIYFYDNQPLFYVTDFLLVPIFIYVIHRYLTNYIKNKPDYYKEYFIKAWYVRLVGCILTALMYDYYYNGGDTITYYHYALGLNKLLFTDPSMIINLLFDPKGFYSTRFLHETPLFVESGVFLLDGTTAIVIWIASACTLIFLRSFLLSSITFTLFAFYGCWKLFSVFYDMYPHLKKQLAFACLFIPSVFFWGTGVMKEPLCLGGLGLLTFNVYGLFFKRGNKIKNLILASIGGFIVFAIKVYIILAFLPALAVWVFARYRYTIKSPFLKAIATPLFITFGMAAGVFVLQTMATFAKRYAFEEMMRTAQDTQNWLIVASKQNGGSFYTLGDIEYSAMGLVKIFPKAINVALFRPYIWEIRKPILLAAALEGIVTLYLTITLLFKAGFIRFLKLVAGNPEVQFCLVFSVIFAFAVGFTSFNFGALARYKIPFMPFYYIALFILADAQQKDKLPEVKK